MLVEVVLPPAHSGGKQRTPEGNRTNSPRQSGKRPAELRLDARTRQRPWRNIVACEYADRTLPAFRKPASRDARTAERLLGAQILLIEPGS
jgi:hypothetical protein